MRLRCRLGVHLIDAGARGHGQPGRLRLLRTGSSYDTTAGCFLNENVTREQDRAARRQAKIDKAKEARHDH